MKVGIYIRAHKAHWNDDIDIAIIKYMKSGKIGIGELTLTEQEEGGIIQPILTLSHIDQQLNNTAQILMDDLWDCGIRPTEGHGSVGQLKATEEHLADMKKITFHQLKIEDKK